LTPAGEFHINVDQYLRVEQGAVFHPAGSIDPITVAKRIEIVGGSRMPAPRECERICHTLER
jgi:hypothetical protein